MADDARADLLERAPGASSPDDLAGDVLARLTTDEKLAMLHQHAPAVERLGLAAFRTGTEALHGVAWLGTATVFPQPVGLAASWDPALLREVGQVVAVEVRAKHAADPSVSLNVWAPVVNTLRHPLWGRTEEGYSEDPDLTSALATGYCAGLRGDHPTVWRTVPTLKHFLAYGNETDRAVTSSHLPPQALREYELPAHLGPAAHGCVGAVMPSYNLVNGRPSHVATELIAELRAAAPSSMAIVSDAAAPTNLVESERFFPDHVASHGAALLAGVDSFTDNDADASVTLDRLRGALAAGLVTQDDVDAAALRLLTLRARTGELDPEADPYRSASVDDLDRPEHRALARRSVAASVVVLENDGTLPLRPPARIAVVGPFADHVVHDWYSGTPPYRTGIATALRERYPDAEVVVADGSDRIALRSSTTGRYVVVDPDGRGLRAEGAADDVSAHLDVTDWGGGVLTLRSVATGSLLTGASWMLAADAERVGGWVAQETFRQHHHADGTVSLQHVGSRGWVRVQDDGGLVVAAESAAVAERFVVRTLRAGHAAVAEACRRADAVLVTVGNDPHVLGRETEDRPGLNLPLSQREMWQVAIESGVPAVLTIVSSYPYAVGDLAPDAAAVVWTSHGGQELGPGLVDVLAGDVEPSGRLAQTWWADERDAGDILEYDVVGARMTYRYSEASPLYGLGHGLTYGDVRYEKVTLSQATVTAPAATTAHEPAAWAPDDAEATLHAEIVVGNAGERPARELVALYAHAPGDLPVTAPRRRLVAWTHVDLAPGEARHVVLPVRLGHLAVWDVSATTGTDLPATPGAFVVQPGAYVLAAGASAVAPTATATLVVEGPAAPVRRTRTLEAHGFHAAQGVVTTAYEPLTGSAIDPAAGARTSWARYDRVDLGVTSVGADGTLRLRAARAARLQTAAARVVLHARTTGSSTPWQEVADVVVPTGAAGTWQDVTVPATLPPGALDLRVELVGPVRLATIAVE